MNFEKIGHISDRIETPDKKEQEDILFEKIEQISLIYADKKFQEIKEENKDSKFSDVVSNFTPLRETILEPIYSLPVADFSYKENKEKIDLFLDSFYEEVDALYNEVGFDLEKIFDLVQLKKDSIKEYLGVENLKKYEPKKSEFDTKIVKFYDLDNIGAQGKENLHYLEELGFSAFDDCIEIHVKEFFKTEENNFGPELVKADLGIIAEHIIDEVPTTAAIIGRSWLLDTPLADHLGFKKINDDEVNQNDFATWLQFIDKDGQINKKRFNEFLATGELPYKNVKGIISTEEFLERYLPENRRGKVVIKEIDKEKEKFWLELQNGKKLLAKEWGSLLENGGNFDEFIKNELLGKLLNFFDPGDKKQYLSFLKTMSEDGIPWSEFYKYRDENIIKIERKIGQGIKNDLYRDKEIVID